MRWDPRLSLRPWWGQRKPNCVLAQEQTCQRPDWSLDHAWPQRVNVLVPGNWVFLPKRLGVMYPRLFCVHLRNPGFPFATLLDLLPADILIVIAFCWLCPCPLPPNSTWDAAPLKSFAEDKACAKPSKPGFLSSVSSHLLAPSLGNQRSLKADLLQVN